MRSKPTDLVQKQALAAVGQALLMRYYDDFFSTLGKRCAQVLRVVLCALGAGASRCVRVDAL